MEIDTEEAIKDILMLASDFVAEGRRGAGVDIATKLGLEEFAALLDNAPPGIDELVALTQAMKLVKFGDFDRVVLDTAPTGHTLRLWSCPEFLDTFLGKVIRLKNRLDSSIDKLRSVIGRKDGKPDEVDKAAKEVQRLRENMEELRDMVRDKQRTQYAVVTVATGLAMAESERFVKSLKKDGVMVKNLIINQIIGDTAATVFVRRIIDNQSKYIEQLREAGAEKEIELTEVPYFDVEVRGTYGLQVMAKSMFSPIVQAD
ncbi:ATPase ASNA1-like [Gracilariopsis chorda]|uniref:ATPase ASNA1-like n=1 Tax=Gracilariopsis chorda TaxID=448386 RepID=A0A2V3ITW3_9FLOR|nr:ATPase ASNA1-like [Gracilariopsis chorda]|eukprot:PXF45542.1 ATPase ASNA1-like [Gracilariopsis chorda]